MPSPGIEDDIAEEPQEEDADEGIDVDEEEDEMADFIVDEVDEDGEPVRRKKTKKKKVVSTTGVVSSHALREAQEIFGDVTGLLEEYEQMKDARAAEEAPAQEEHEPGEDREQTRAIQIAEKHFDPEILKESYLTRKDETIRRADIPERMQMQEIPQLHYVDYDQEARWIYEQLFSISAPQRLAKTILEQGRREEVRNGRLFMRSEPRTQRMIQEWRENEQEQIALLASIRDVLYFLREDNLEVPAIAMYRKDYCGELLNYRAEDVPSLVTHDEAARSDGNLAAGEVKLDTRFVRRWDILWAIEMWDVKWRFLQHRCESLVTAYNVALSAAQNLGDEKMTEGIQTCLESIVESSTSEQLNDLDAKFQLLQPPQEAMSQAIDALSLEELDTNQRNRLLSRFRKPGSGMGRLGRKKSHHEKLMEGIGMSAEELSDNIISNYKKHAPADPRLPASEMLVDLVEEQTSRDMVMREVIRLAAEEIAAEPVLRRMVRGMYRSSASISTIPTIDGARVVDPFHPKFAHIKRLRSKPLALFYGTSDFLAINAAEEDGLIIVSMGMPDAQKAQLSSQLQDLFLSEGVNAAAQSWNDVRRGIIYVALNEIILPALEQELRVHLLAEARECVKHTCRDSIWERVSSAPYRPKAVHASNSDEEVIPDIRIMSCVCGPGKPPTTFVMLDAAGKLVDILMCGTFVGRPPLKRPDATMPKNVREDIERLAKFIAKHSPHVLAFSASSFNYASVKDELIQEAINQVVDDMPGSLPVETGMIEVVWCEPSVAKLWALSALSTRELGEQPQNVREGVALARYMKDPAALIAALAGSHGKEVLSLSQHPLQDYLSKEERLGVMAESIITAINQIGVDINLTVQNEWLSWTLQFVSGLGPRKAKAMLNAIIKSGGAVQARREVMDLANMGKVVFSNCAGSLRIVEHANVIGENDFEPIDGTRIHPEDYELVRELAKSAFGQTMLEEELMIDRLFDDPTVLDSIDADILAAEVESRMQVKKHANFVDVILEIRQPYRDMRRKWQKPTTIQIFNYLAGESASFLRRGRLVQATVKFVYRDFVVVVLDESGIPGFIDHFDVSDQNLGYNEVRDLLQPGASLTARIVDILPQGKSLDDIGPSRLAFIQLCTRGSVLQNNAAYEQELEARDLFYSSAKTDQEVAAERAQRQRAAEIAKRKDKTFSRLVNHNMFQNRDVKEVDLEFQADGSQGDFLFTPVAGKFDRILLTLFFHRGMESVVISHHLIREGEKEIARTGKGQSMASKLQLGKPLTVIGIDGTPIGTYEDLDEICGRCIDPLVRNMLAFTGHPKFREGSEEGLEKVVKSAREAKPNVIPYFLAVSYRHPGAYYLCYLVSRNHPRREYIFPLPDGYKFRDRTFSNIDHMINWWKSNYFKKNK